MSYESDSGYDGDASEETEVTEAAEDTEITDESQEELYSESEDEETAENAEDSEEAAEGKSEEEIRAEINEKSEYSSEINDHIKSVEELEVYQKAGLVEQEVDGRKCLIRTDIDMDYVDEDTGKTNRQLMEEGRAPIDAKTGETIELHHIGQDYDSPLAELTEDTEHGGENHAKLHSKEGDSWRNDPKKNNHYNGTQRPNHWKARAK